MTDLNTLYSKIFSDKLVVVSTLSEGDFFLGGSKFQIYKILEIRKEYIMLDIVYKDMQRKWDDLNIEVYPEIK